jgi:hypothetical protein
LLKLKVMTMHRISQNIREHPHIKKIRKLRILTKIECHLVLRVVRKTK